MLGGGTVGVGRVCQYPGREGGSAIYRRVPMPAARPLVLPVLARPVGTPARVHHCCPLVYVRYRCPCTPPEVSYRQFKPCAKGGYGTF